MSGKLIRYSVDIYDAIGDGVTGDTSSIHEYLTNSRHVYILSGIYLIDAGTSIIVQSNQALELADNLIQHLASPELQLVELGQRWIMSSR